MAYGVVFDGSSLIKEIAPYVQQINKLKSDVSDDPVEILQCLLNAGSEIYTVADDAAFNVIDDPNHEKDLDEINCDFKFQTAMTCMLDMVAIIERELKENSVPFELDDNSPFACTIIGTSVYLAYEQDPYKTAGG